MRRTWHVHQDRKGVVGLDGPEAPDCAAGPVLQTALGCPLRCVRRRAIHADRLNDALWSADCCSVCAASAVLSFRADVTRHCSSLSCRHGTATPMERSPPESHSRRCGQPAHLLVDAIGLLAAEQQRQQHAGGHKEDREQQRLQHAPLAIHLSSSNKDLVD